jgi:hypothetical protein
MRSNWLEPRELDRFPTETRAKALQTVQRRVAGIRYVFTFLAVYGVSYGAITALEYAIFGRLGVGGRWGMAVVGVITGGLTATVSAMLFRQRRAREYRVLLCEQGVPVCIHCGYDLRGQTVARCPECGRRFDPTLLSQRSDSGAEAHQPRCGGRPDEMI